jgi:hypothetical protein
MLSRMHSIRVEARGWAPISSSFDTPLTVAAQDEEMGTLSMAQQY